MSKCGSGTAAEAHFASPRQIRACSSAGSKHRPCRLDAAQDSPPLVRNPATITTSLNKHFSPDESAKVCKELLLFQPQNQRRRTSWKTDKACCRASNICSGNSSLAGWIRESGLRLKDCIPCARLSTSPSLTLSSERILSVHSRRFSILHDFIRH